MKITLKLVSYLLSGIVLLNISSCGSGENEVAQTVTMEEDSEDEGGMEIDFMMPSPLQIASIFKRAGLTYQDGLASSPEKASQYSSQLSKALNFGVYAADLSYCVLNKQSQEAIKYMQAVKQLSDNLGMTSVFGSADLFKSFEKNISNEDSMIFILATVQDNLDEHLESNEQQFLSVVFFAGGWTEGMYLGTQMVKDGSSQVASRLVEQIVILENLIKALENYPSKSDDLDNLIADLKKIDNMYRNFESIKSQDAEDISFKDIVLTQTEVDNLVNTIVNLRTRIVNG
jgi:hypothetical protein